MTLTNRLLFVIATYLVIIATDKDAKALPEWFQYAIWLFAPFAVAIFVWMLKAV